MKFTSAEGNAAIMGAYRIVAVDQQGNSMDENLFSLQLSALGLRVLTPSVSPEYQRLLSDDGTDEPLPFTAANGDLLDFDEDEDDQDGTDDDDILVFSEHGGPGRDKENTNLVAAAFRAAGDPRYQDVRFKPAKANHWVNPTPREISLKRAKLINRTVEW
jgi:hypothetical protein